MGIRYTRKERDDDDRTIISFEDALRGRQRSRERNYEYADMEHKMTKIAIFVSGNGTNCENIINYFADSKKIQVALVLSNRSDAYALVRAKNHNVATEILSKADFNDADKLIPLLDRYAIDFIVLAGFLLMIPPFLIDAYPRRIINIHPSLLPKYGGKGMYGMHVHEAVKKAGETETGMTVHYVSNICDGGEIIAQHRIDITPDDTPEDIAHKEQSLEQKYFPQIIEQLLSR